MNKRSPPHEDDFDEAAPLTDEEVGRLRPASQVLPPAAAKALVRKPGRPPIDASRRKQPVSIRLSPDVLEMLRATGDGWQTRVDDILRMAMGLGERPAQPADRRAEVTKKAWAKVKEGGKTPSAGTTLFERMANLSKGPQIARSAKTGRIEAKARPDTRDGKKKA